MKRRIAALLLLFAIVQTAFADEPYVVVIGVGEDAGVFQMGCDTPFCRRAWKDQSFRQTVSSTALVDPDSKSGWLFDATPGLPSQSQFLKQKAGDLSNRIGGIFLTHTYAAHYTDLLYLGRGGFTVGFTGMRLDL